MVLPPSWLHLTWKTLCCHLASVQLLVQAFSALLVLIDHWVFQMSLLWEAHGWGLVTWALLTLQAKKKINLCYNRSSVTKPIYVNTRKLLILLQEVNCCICGEFQTYLQHPQDIAWVVKPVDTKKKLRWNNTIFFTNFVTLALPLKFNHSFLPLVILVLGVQIKFDANPTQRILWFGSKYYPRVPG